MNRLTDRQVKQLHSLCKLHFPYAKADTINGEDNNVDYGEDWILKEFKDLLVKFGAISKRTKIQNLNYLKMNKKSVAPHEDEYYADAIGAKRAYLFILDIHKPYNINSEMSDFYLYFYHSRKWDHMRVGDYIKFNPKIDHAVINNFSTKVLVVWV